jgi:hypothetical protein
VIDEASINPYYLAFSGILSGLAAETTRFSSLNTVEFIPGDQALEKDKISHTWNFLKTNGSPNTQELIGGSPSFLDSWTIGRFCHHRLRILLRGGCKNWRWKAAARNQGSCHGR